MEHAINTSTGRPRGVRILFWVFIGILTALFFAAIFAVAVTLLWNWLMTDLFGLKSIDYFQAFGLVLLARLLVGGWHRGHRDSGHSPFDRMFGKKEVPRFHDVPNREAFRQFWDQEGREAFKSYLNSRKGETE
ncbi:MAG: hypothetical protein JXA41_14815 [Deltaproteobacteria bacterium]|nr:hypothetical protein [Deltaproteobacteria bacterium]